MRILTVIGTRPEAIKMAPVLRELQRRSQQVESLVCVTAQHREMLDQVLNLFAIQPRYDLEVIEDDQTPTQVASAVLARLEPILTRERPDWVLVQGDTTSAAAASLAAFYAGVRVAHVEAGLRSHDKQRPFPEEVNRRLVSILADLHFAPTERARRNLIGEGIAAASIVVTGNPVIDALQWAAAQPAASGALETGWPAPSDKAGRHSDVRLILVTVHRRENQGRPLENVCMALQDLAERYGDCVRIVYPVHLNPNVWAPVHRLLDGVPNVILTQPLDYLPMVQLMKRAYLVLTDSGGIQEEAPGLGVPVLVLREVTERPEAVEAGTVRLVGTDREHIVSEASRLLDDPAEHERMARAINPYGDGHASTRIVSALLGEAVPPFEPSRPAA